MKKYLIQRNIPGAEKLTPTELAGAAATSNAALAKIGPERIQWVSSHVVKDGTMCLYLADNEETVREHSRLSGFPANVITEVAGQIDPTTAG
jgi:hypothetical protein